MAGEFKFEISLSVLNHLGRNLYRSFATVLGEAISNSWDADAENVYIFIDKDENGFVIKDDGIGMDSDDFQNKFLRIGYSKREVGGSSSQEGRPFIGRKGIGKLALLSCAERITVISKKSGSEEYVGGTIDNSGLDEAIKDDVTPDEYSLDPIKDGDFSQYTKDHNHGTIIRFENIKDGIKSRIENLQKIIALYFRFSLQDSSFTIHMNGKKITLKHLEVLAQNTQFVWNINKLDDPYISEMLTNLQEDEQSIEMEGKVDGFIASVYKPRDLSILTTGERESVDLFVNGRLRERDILKHIPTARVAENYFYGQIHFNELDDDQDRFTSSREGVVADDPKYTKFLEDFRDIILKIVDSWDTLRVDNRDDGDPENSRMLPGARKGRELYNVVSKEYALPKDSPNQEKVKRWLNDLGPEAAYNFPAYANCFAAENLLRKYIEDTGRAPTNCVTFQECGETCAVRRVVDPNKGWCAYCRGEKGRNSLRKQKSDAGISSQIRKEEDNILVYLDYIDLAKIIKNDILTNQNKLYRLIRNSVMHTSRLTKKAKRQLNCVFHNVVETVKKLVGGS